MNGGWVQVMGPIGADRAVQGDRNQRRSSSGLQQIRWPPDEHRRHAQAKRCRGCSCCPARTTAIRSSAGSSRSRPAGLGFLNSRALGPQYRKAICSWARRAPTCEGGHLFRFNLTGNRRKIAVDDPRLEDRVADNLAKYDITESESLLFGTNFGVGTDIRTGPNGNLFVVSLSHGAVYEIFRNR